MNTHERLEVIISDNWDVQEVPVSLEFLQKIGVAHVLEWDEYEERYIVDRETYDRLMRIDMETWIHYSDED